MTDDTTAHDAQSETAMRAAIIRRNCGEPCPHDAARFVGCLCDEAASAAAAVVKDAIARLTAERDELLNPLASRMVSRKEAARMANAMFNSDLSTSREKGDNWHFGRQELRELLDAIYGRPPTSPDECIETTRRG